VLGVLLVSLLGPGCGDDDGAAAVDAAPPDAPGEIEYCVTYDTTCTWSSQWDVSPDHPTFPDYNVTVRTRPGEDGLMVRSRLVAADGTQVGYQEAGMSYSPANGLSEGLIVLRFCAPGAANGQQTTFTSSVRRSDGSVYAERTDTIAVACTGTTCAQVCAAP
jgi:hypothetical protein